MKENEERQKQLAEEEIKENEERQKQLAQVSDCNLNSRTIEPKVEESAIANSDEEENKEAESERQKQESQQLDDNSDSTSEKCPKTHGQ